MFGSAGSAGSRRVDESDATLPERLTCLILLRFFPCRRPPTGVQPEGLCGQRKMLNWLRLVGASVRVACFVAATAWFHPLGRFGGADREFEIDRTPLPNDAEPVMSLARVQAVDVTATAAIVTYHRSYSPR